MRGKGEGDLSCSGSSVFVDRQLDFERERSTPEYNFVAPLFIVHIHRCRNSMPIYIDRSIVPGISERVYVLTMRMLYLVNHTSPLSLSSRLLQHPPQQPLHLFLERFCSRSQSTTPSQYTISPTPTPDSIDGMKSLNTHRIERAPHDIPHLRSSSPPPERRSFDSVPS